MIMQSNVQIRIWNTSLHTHS